MLTIYTTDSSQTKQRQTKHQGEEGEGEQQDTSGAAHEKECEDPREVLALGQGPRHRQCPPPLLCSQLLLLSLLCGQVHQLLTLLGCWLALLDPCWLRGSSFVVGELKVAA